MAEVKSGYMYKCGKAVKSWKKRWFVLKPNGYLYYYEGPNKSEKGKIDIVDAVKVAPWQEVGTAERKLPSGLTSENAFAIVASDRTYTCCCEQDGENLSWIAAIEKVRGAANGGEQQYPPPTYPEKAEVKQDNQLMSSPPPYAPSSPITPTPTPPLTSGPPPAHSPCPSPAHSPGPPPPAHNAGPPPPVMGMPDPHRYGGTMPIGHAQQPPPPRAPPTGNPRAGPGYQGAYPVGNYQPARNPPPPQQPPRPQYYQQPPPRPQQLPPRPQYYQQPPRPAYPSYPQRPPPPQQYYRPPPPQYYRPPPPPQQRTTTVTVVTIPAPQQRIIYR